MSVSDLEPTDDGRGFVCRAVEVHRTGSARRSTRVLTEVQACFCAGEATLVVGPTGSGKSTLIYVLAGLLRPTAGEVLAGGQPISRWTSAHRDRWRRRAGICFQRPELWPDLTGLENVMVPLLPRGDSVAALRARAGTALERSGVPELAGHMAREMSSGEQQRVAFARAIVTAPRYLLVDEPTAHQDDDGVSVIVKALSEEAARGATVVVTSHDSRLIEHEGQPWTSQRYRIGEGRLVRAEGDA